MSEHKNKSFEELETLTNNLPPIPNLKDIIVQNSALETGALDFSVDGVAKAFPLIFSSEVAVSKVYMSKGSAFEEHIHEGSKEIVICYKGVVKIILTETNKEIILKESDTYTIDTSKPHIAIAIEDCRFIAITIPGDRYYPKI